MAATPAGGARRRVRGRPGRARASTAIGYEALPASPENVASSTRNGPTSVNDPDSVAPSRTSGLSAQSGSVRSAGSTRATTSTRRSPSARLPSANAVADADARGARPPRCGGRRPRRHRRAPSLGCPRRRRAGHRGRRANARLVTRLVSADGEPIGQREAVGPGEHQAPSRGGEGVVDHRRHRRHQLTGPGSRVAEQHLDAGVERRGGGDVGLERRLDHRVPVGGDGGSQRAGQGGHEQHRGQQRQRCAGPGGDDEGRSPRPDPVRGAPAHRMAVTAWRRRAPSASR